MKQCDVYLADLSPTRGSEQSGMRPVVIISGNTLNDNMDICIVCPLSSKIKKYYSCVEIQKNKQNNLSQNSEVIPFQIRTVTKQRLVKKIGKISKQQLALIFSGLVDILRY